MALSASILFYADEADFNLIRKHLNEHPDIAYIVADGKERFRAVRTVPRLPRFESQVVTLWHVPGGPLPLLHRPDRLLRQKETKIPDPFKGWKQLHPRNCPEVFFADPPCTITIRVQPQARYAKGGVGMSGFGWIGNRYGIIGIRARKATEKFWKELGRWVKANATLTPRTGKVTGRGRAPNSPGNPIWVWAFPSALASFQRGRGRDEDWW